MYTIELIEYLLQVLLLDALTRIADREVEFLLIIPGTDVDVERFLLLAILDGIVHEVGNSILEMYLIDEDSRIDGLNLRINLTTRMLYTQGEGLGNLLYHFVQVELLLLEHHTLLVEHRHLEYLLYQETQTLGLIGNNATEVLGHLF